ncbi:ATP-binding protein [Olsenella uli]|uniref:ATP-binding protein n=1 Tax=Olsenella uli TaxID=133926 RepID=UPI00195D75B2|nr:ATP-binding protein [Olsenella uli]MBM6676075.1 ATP-binding protein [Olsenella uli]
MFQRAQVDILSGRLSEPNIWTMQFVVGPRQTGKSTILAQALAKVDVAHHFVSADEVANPNAAWIEREWQVARDMTLGGRQTVVFCIDEAQKVPGWARQVMGLYDRDRREGIPVRVVLSGSSSLLLHKGMEDSLMGRYEIIRSPHWSLSECSDAFGFSIDQFLYFGGYPGAAAFASDELRWKAYLRDAIIEPTIARDVLEMEEVRKPALMRALFRLGCAYSGQELSYNKMLGQLQDNGNTVTLAHYLDLLDKAGMIFAMPKFSDKELTRRRSSPRLMVHDTSLMTATSDKGKDEFLAPGELRGHLVESAVGAYLLARSANEGFDVMWWREGNREVDFVLRRGSSLTAVEVKSGAETRQSGMAQFLDGHPGAKRIVVGGASAGACSVEKFLLGEVELFY